ncbi:MAG: peroxide stress protein YaaA [Gammaproteobacteria bacterium]|nr:MAG: peroxide stress protein YaaA [Gammaproteobacteria bacterium]
MLTVISPAKKLDFKSTPVTTTFTTPDFLDQSRKLIQALRDYSEIDLIELMNISQKIAALNFDRYAEWKTPFTEENATQAIFAFRGDVYTGLDADTLKAKDLNFAQKHLRILSGLYGVLRPLDLMQAYRLEMGTRLENERGKNLYEFWGNRITDKLNDELSSHKTKTLINLASNEYFKSVMASSLKGNLVTPAFKEKKNGQYKMIGIHAKKARGLMSRFIIVNRIDKPDDLKKFDTDGYRYNPEISDDSNWVFTRG